MVGRWWVDGGWVGGGSKAALLSVSPCDLPLRVGVIQARNWFKAIKLKLLGGRVGSAADGSLATSNSLRLVFLRDLAKPSKT